MENATKVSQLRKKKVCLRSFREAESIIMKFNIQNEHYHSRNMRAFCQSNTIRFTNTQLKRVDVRANSNASLSRNLMHMH